MPSKKHDAVQKVKQGVQYLLDLIECQNAKILTSERVIHSLEVQLDERNQKIREMRETIVQLRASLRGSIKDE